jgi:hypothetical protein
MPSGLESSSSRKATTLALAWSCVAISSKGEELLARRRLEPPQGLVARGQRHGIAVRERRQQIRRRIVGPELAQGGLAGPELAGVVGRDLLGGLLLLAAKGQQEQSAGREQEGEAGCNGSRHWEAGGRG